MCGDCFGCIYLVCQCDGLELGRRNRRITVRGVAVRINILTRQRYKYTTVFVDQASRMGFVYLQKTCSAEETIEAKRAFE